MRPTFPLPIEEQESAYKPATAFAHSSNEPVQPLGTGIALDRPLATSHAINAVVSDSAARMPAMRELPRPTSGSVAPCSPLSAPAVSLPHHPPLTAGSMVLRDAAGLVVDSLNYGALVDPWAAEGFRPRLERRRVAASAPARRSQILRAPNTISDVTNRSAGRFPDGNDTDSNCNDFLTQPPPTCWPLPAAAQPTSKSAAWQTLAAAKLSRWIPAQAARRLSSQRWAPRRNRICNSHHCGVTVIPVAGLMASVRPGHRNRHRRES